MSCKSALYAVNSIQQDVAINGAVNLGTPVRKFGNNVNISGGNLAVQGPGYYDIDANFTFTSDTAGTVTVSLYKDGALIPGAVGSVAIAANGTGSVTIPAIIRQLCCVQSVVTAVITGLAVTATNAAILAEKI